MALSKNKAVREAYAEGTYTDVRGDSWWRGMDGWFLMGGPEDGPLYLVRHDDMVAEIEKENPDA